MNPHRFRSRPSQVTSNNRSSFRENPGLYNKGVQGRANNNRQSVREQKFAKWKAQSPEQLDQELRGLDNEINRLLRQVDKIRGEQNTVRKIMDEKRLGGNQYAALASWSDNSLDSIWGHDEE